MTGLLFPTPAERLGAKAAGNSQWLTMHTLDDVDIADLMPPCLPAKLAAPYEPHEFQCTVDNEGKKKHRYHNLTNDPAAGGKRTRKRLNSRGGLVAQLDQPCQQPCWPSNALDDKAKRYDKWCEEKRGELLKSQGQSEDPSSPNVLHRDGSTESDWHIEDHRRQADEGEGSVISEGCKTATSWSSWNTRMTGCSTATSTASSCSSRSRVRTGASSQMIRLYDFRPADEPAPEAPSPLNSPCHLPHQPCIDASEADIQSSSPRRHQQTHAFNGVVPNSPNSSSSTGPSDDDFWSQKSPKRSNSKISNNRVGRLYNVDIAEAQSTAKATSAERCLSAPPATSSLRLALSKMKTKAKELLPSRMLGRRKSC